MQGRVVLLLRTTHQADWAPISNGPPLPRGTFLGLPLDHTHLTPRSCQLDQNSEISKLTWSHTEVKVEIYSLFLCIFFFSSLIAQGSSSEILRRD